ncbi:hypothetical protein GGER_00360 [Serratia rubidaea]
MQQTLLKRAGSALQVREMKEKEKAEIKRLSDQLDALNHKDVQVIQQGNPELIAQHSKEKRSWRRRSSA